MGFADFQAAQQATSGDAFPGTGADLYAGISKQLEVVPVHIGGKPPTDFSERRGANGPGSATAYDSEPNFVTVGKAMQGFYSMDVNGLAALQERLVNAGALDAGSFVPGQPDPATEKAYAEVVKRAAFSGRTVLDVLAQSEAAVRAAGGLGALSKRAPLSIDLTNPADLRRVIESGAEKVYGHANVDETTVQHIIGAVQAQQAAEQRSKYAGAGQVTQAADPSTIAENELRAADPAAAATQQYRSYADQVFKLLGSGGGS